MNNDNEYIHTLDHVWNCIIEYKRDLGHLPEKLYIHEDWFYKCRLGKHLTTGDMDGMAKLFGVPLVIIFERDKYGRDAE